MTIIEIGLILFISPFLFMLGLIPVYLVIGIYNVFVKNRE